MFLESNNMKKLICVLAFVFAGSVFAHVPVPTPAGKKVGDFPPKLNDKPLPPMLINPTGIPGCVVWLNNGF